MVTSGLQGGITMDQRLITQLLKEASCRDCLPARRQEIADIFLAATPEGDNELAPGNDIAAGIRTVLMRIWTKATEEKPEVLPLLFPVFALICGDKTGPHFSRINWEIFDQI